MMSPNQILYVVVAVIICVQSSLDSAASASEATTAPTDAVTLLTSFFQDTNGVKWRTSCSKDWLNSTVSVCNWPGIACSSATFVQNGPKAKITSRTVTSIKLTKCGLSGTLPQWLLATAPPSTPPTPAGMNATVISVQLTKLDLSNNKIGGTLPSSYGGSSWGSTLATFAVGDNALSGTLPDEYSAWANIVTFDVNSNDISGTLPSTYNAWRQIQTFRANYNDLTGTLPTSYSQWGGSITTIDLSVNALAGTLPPQYQSFVNIGTFSMNRNSLTGSLPSAYSLWTAITTFDVGQNVLTGTLPTAFLSWSGISYFSAEANQLTGALPIEWSSWTFISHFDVSNNNGITGTLPEVYARFASMRLFSAARNKISGSVPAVYSNWSSISYVDISHNSLSGALPSSLSAWGRYISEFHVNDNILSGSLPESFRNWTNMTTFVAYANTFSGSLPADWSVWSQLEVFQVWGNKLSGTVPLQYFSQPFCRTLQHLDISYNTLNGTFPLQAALSNCWQSLQQLLLADNAFSGDVFSGVTFNTKTSPKTALLDLNLGDNEFSGTIPNDRTLALLMPHLQTFHLYNNLFHGPLPIAPVAWWTNLLEFQAESNHFSGNITRLDDEVARVLEETSPVSSPSSWSCSIQLFSIQFNIEITGQLPASLAFCVNMSNFQAVNTPLAGSLPSTYGDGWANSISYFIVRAANVTGTVPDSFAKWTKLTYFDIGQNNLTGVVDFVDSWRSLETLRLSNNQFIGTLPAALALNVNLTNLYLQYNQFEGTINPNFGAGCPLIVQFCVQGNLLQGSLPAQLSQWRSIRRFLAYNNSFSGTLPSEWSAWGSSITQINIAQNQLEGTLPPQWGAWISLNTITAVENHFTGNLPPSWSQWSLAGTLSLDRNSLTGTLPLAWASLSSISILSLSENFLEGPLPPEWGQLPLLLLLMLQGNANLSGSISSLKMLPSGSKAMFYVSYCRTKLFGTSPRVVGLCYPCVPEGDDITKYSDNPLGVLEYCVFTPQTQAPTPVLQNETSAPAPSPPQATASRNSAGVSIVGSTAAAAIGGDPGSAQMLASLLLSKCMCASSSGSTSDDDVFSVVLSSLTLSPFTALGPAAMAFGNSALIVLIFVGHVSVAVVVTRRNSSEADNSSQMTTGTEPKQNRWKSTKNSVGAYIVQRWVALCTSPQAIALRFPNLSVGGAMFLVPGLVRGFVVVFGDMNSTPLETIGAFLSTVVLLFYTSVILEWLIYRNLILLGLQEIDSNGFATSAPLHFEPYDSRHPFTPPVPKWLASVAFSRDGRWMPADKRNSFGKLVSPLKPSFAHWWLAIPLLNIFTTLLSSLPTTSTLGCDALQGIITTASAAMSVALVAVRPHRALIVSIVAAASLIVVAVTSALGLACRHGLVSLDELLSVCSALSYVALVGKVYVALLPNLESHILQLSANVASVVPSSPKTFRKRHIGKKATPVIARDASFASNLNSSGQKQRHHKTTRQQQCTVLKQLVEAICVKRRSYAIEDILLRKS